MRLDSKSQSGILDLITPFLVIGIFAFVVIFSYTQYFKQELEKYLPGGAAHDSTVLLQLEGRGKYLAQLQQLDGLYEKYVASDNDLISSIIPLEKNTAELFANYEKLAHDLGMTLQVISINEDASKKQTTNGIKEISISLKLSNIDYLRLKRFLMEMESDVRLADITQIDFDPSGQFLSINAKVYYGGQDWKPKSKIKKAVKAVKETEPIAPTAMSVPPEGAESVTPPSSEVINQEGVAPTDVSVQEGVAPADAPSVNN